MGRLASHILQAGEMGLPGALAIATKRKSSERIQLILKAAVDAGSTASDSAIVALAPVSAAFLQLLRGPSFYDNLAVDAIALPVNTRVVVASGTGVATIVDELAPAPLLQSSFSAPSLQEVRAQVIVALSQELVRSGGAPLEAAINRDLRNAVAKATNLHFINTVTPVGSPSPDIPSAGTDSAGVLEDIALLIAELNTDAYSKIHIGMSTALCKILTTLPDLSGRKAFPEMGLAGGQLAGYQVTAVGELADDEVLAVDASRFAVNVGSVSIDRSGEADLDFETEPTNPPVAATVKKSLWQMNMVALKAERRFAFHQLTTNAVAKLVDVEWGAAS